MNPNPPLFLLEDKVDLSSMESDGTLVALRDAFRVEDERFNGGVDLAICYKPQVFSGYSDNLCTIPLVVAMGFEDANLKMKERFVSDPRQFRFMAFYNDGNGRIVRYYEANAEGMSFFAVGEIAQLDTLMTLFCRSYCKINIKQCVKYASGGELNRINCAVDFLNGSGKR